MQCQRCERWFASAGGLAVHHCQPRDPCGSMDVPRSADSQPYRFATTVGVFSGDPSLIDLVSPTNARHVVERSGSARI